MSERIRRIAVNSVWLGVDTAVGMFAGFLGSILVARALGPEKLGYYSYVLWIVSITGVLGTFGVPMATRKYMSEYIGKGEPGVALAVLRFTLRFQLLVCAVILAVGMGVIAAMVAPELRIFACLAVLSLLPALMLGIVTNANLAVEDMASNVASSIISTVVMFAAILATLYFHWDLIGLAASMLVGRSVDFCVRWFLHRSRFPYRADSYSVPPLPDALRRSLWRFCWHSSWLQIFNLVVWDRSEVFFLERFCRIEEVAYYNTGFNITQQLLMLPRIFAGAAGANLMVRAGLEPSALAPMSSTMLRYIVLVAFALSAGLTALSGPAVHVLYGERYAPMIPVLALLAVFCSAKAMLVPAQQYLTTIDRLKILLRATIAVSVINIGLDVWLIRSHASMGAAWANSASQFLGMALVWWSIIRYAGGTFPTGPVLRNLAAAAAMGGLVWAAGSLLPDILALSVGVPLGALLYVLFLRLFRVLDAGDAVRFASLAKGVPPRFRPQAQWVIRFITRK